MNEIIGFIGTGLMGSGMVKNLVRRGYTVRIYNRTRPKAEEAARAGGTVVSSPAEAARGADVIVTMLADPAAVLAVVEGDEGILTTIRPGAVLIDSSTISPAATERVRVALAARGARMLDAPVFGSKKEAENGELGFIVGGEVEVVEQVRSVLQSMGKINHVGTHGMGVNAKLIVNLIMAATLEAFNEGLALATKLGLKAETMVEVVNSSRARSGILDMKVPRILARDFTTFFPLRLMAKDVGLLVETARAAGAAVPCAERVAEVYQACVARGLGDEDFAATIKFLEIPAPSSGKKTDA